MFKRDKFNRIIEGIWTLPEFEYLKNNLWVFTEKVDGTNIRVKWDGAKVTFGGRTDNASIPTYLYNKLEDRFKTSEQVEIFKETFGTDNEICLYGEGYGAKIQKGGGNYNPSGVDFVLFDVRVANWWLLRPDIEEIAGRFNIDIVPIVGEGTLADGITLTKSGMKSHWGDFLSEGVIAKPKVELVTRKGDRIITKIKHRDFI